MKGFFENYFYVSFFFVVYNNTAQSLTRCVALRIAVICYGFILKFML